MNYQSTDAFAGGFAREFGLVNSAIESKENRQYRKEMMGMQRVEHDRKIRKEDMLDRVNVLQAWELLNQSENPEERQLAKDTLELSNFPDIPDPVSRIPPYPVTTLRGHLSKTDF
ncbi:hypothetical protein [Endozoicomonas sp. 4G]|uniref:hypothetical protein n=1 Tax=Endozoicomonas sp. 4G TaxID=2872754 RepID=UPI002078DFC7|nr:hypothetical protein [Endozoicomonas sp. 4G]